MYPDDNYPIKDNKLKYVKNFLDYGNFFGLNRYFWLFYIIFNVLICLWQLYYFYLVWGDVDKMIGMTTTFPIEFQGTYKMILIYLQIEQIYKMHQTIEEEFWNFDIANPKLESKLDKRMRLITIILAFHFMGGIFGATIYMAFPVTEYPPEIRSLPIQCWFPFNTNPSPFHEFLYFVLAMNGIFCIVSIGMFDFLFIYFAQHLLAQFDLLKKQLEGLTDIDGVENDVMKIHDEGFQKEIYRRMAVCVKHHNVLLSFGKELQNYSSVNMAIQIPISMVTFIVVGFTLSTSKDVDYIKTFKLVFYFSSISLQLASFALHGSEIEDQSVSVATSAYFCEWNLGKPLFRKGLIMMQMNALKEIKISACGVIQLNNPTLVMIYRQAFSCVTLLESMNQEI